MISSTVTACTTSLSSPTSRIDSGELLRPCTSLSGTLHLPYRHYHRGIPGRPVAFFLGGGPGVSNLGFKPPESWLDLLDVVLLEYRGVGECRPLLSSSHFTRALNQPISRLNLAGAEQVQIGLAQGFHDLHQQGVNFSEFGLDALADDIEALRQHLRLPAVLLVAHSFGTHIAQVMQTKHRQAVHGSLLLSCNIPGGLLWYPDDTQSVWRRWCESNEARDSGLASLIAKLLEHGWERPQAWQSNDSRALMLSFFMSFNDATRLWALKTLAAAQQGSSATWWALGRSFPIFTRFSFNWADFFLKGYTVDASHEALKRCDTQGENALFQSPSSLLFSGIDGFLQAGGKREQQPPVDYRNTLLVTGEFDPSTPIERWPSQLSASQRIILPQTGHADTLAYARQAGKPWLQTLLSAPATA